MDFINYFNLYNKKYIKKKILLYNIMPPKLYNKYTKGRYESEEEMKRFRKIKDNQKNKIRYWKNKYGYDLNFSDYEEFNKHIHVIKNIYDVHDFFINWNPEDPISNSDLPMYVKKHSDLLEAYKSKDYIKTLKKINKSYSKTEDAPNQTNKYIVEF
tara:strand:- start:64 stop:531 length:468 start_codon:yes stop_codon:yes gene_type:complete